MRKWLLALIPILAVSGLAGVAFAQTHPVPVLSDIEITTNDVPQHLSFLFPLSYQAGPGQYAKICGTITLQSDTFTKVVLKTRLECYDKNGNPVKCARLLDKAEIKGEYTRSGVKKTDIFIGKTWEKFSMEYADKLEASDYVYLEKKGDYVQICWYAYVKKNPEISGKIRAYFYAELPDYGIKKEKYSDWVEIKTLTPIISDWTINISIYGALALLAVLALLLKFRA